MAAAKGKEVEVASDLTDRFPVVFEPSSEMAEIMQENLGDGGLSARDLDRVTMPSGGGTSWEVPNIEGDTDPVKEITGIILAWESPRVYWEKSLDESGGAEQPDCSSDDGLVGLGLYGPGSDGNPSGQCKGCPMDRWGSGEDDPTATQGRKACKEQRLLYVLQENTVLPLLVPLPPTSIQSTRNYFRRLASNGLAYYSVVTAIGLEKKTAHGNPFSIASLRLIDRLSPEEVAKVKAFRTMFQRDTQQAAPTEA